MLCVTGHCCTGRCCSVPIPPSKRLRTKTQAETIEVLEHVDAPKVMNWSGDMGFRRVGTMVHVWGFLFLCSRAWWTKNAPQSKTKIPVMCTTCGYLTNPYIHNLNSGFRPGCWCNGRARWSTEQGRLHFLAIIASRGLNVDVSKLTSEWWAEQKPGAFTNIPVRCNVCGYNCLSTISNVTRNSEFGCFCNRGVPWSCEEGRHRFFEIAEERNFRIDLSGNTWEWWQENIHDYHSKIIAPCMDCDYITTSRLNDIVSSRHQRPGCWCTGSVLWRTRAGWERMQHILTELGLDGSLMSFPWWEEHIHDAQSKLLLKCPTCEAVSDKTVIMSIQQGGGMQCLCRWKTQKKLHEWLQTFSKVEREVGSCRNPQTGYPMPLDYFITTDVLKVCIELDGDHHFGWNPFMRKWCSLMAKHDLIKEKWMISQGFSLIRLYQPDVLYDKMDWKGFVNFCMDDIKRGATPRVYTPDIKQYREGLYTELRSLASETTA
jgi:hypothetical protein